MMDTYSSGDSHGLSSLQYIIILALCQVNASVITKAAKEEYNLGTCDSGH